MPRLLAILATVLLATGHAAPPVDLAPLKKWIARQDDFHSVAADFMQTRALRSLRSPLASPGRLWFQAPQSFRWEIGTPAKTIVLRKADSFLIISPGKKKAERVPPAALEKQAGQQGLAMMHFPLAKDFADFQRQFEVLDVRTDGARCEAELAPRDPQARKFLKSLTLAFDIGSGHLLAFEMVTRDGSSMRNEFSNVRVNGKIDPAVFEYDLTGYEVVDAKD